MHSVSVTHKTGLLRTSRPAAHTVTHTHTRTDVELINRFPVGSEERRPTVGTRRAIRLSDLSRHTEDVQEIKQWTEAICCLILTSCGFKLIQRLDTDFGDGLTNKLQLVQT